MKLRTNAEVCLRPNQFRSLFARLHWRAATAGANALLMFALASALSLASVQVVSAQTETVLYKFTGGSDGRHPYNDRLLRDAKGNLYGTTEAGGGSGCYGGFGCGSVFKLAPDGAEIILYRFTGGMDGANPYAGLVQDKEGNLYGTTSAGGDSGCHVGGGGTSGCGTVFKLASKGEEKVLHRFTGGNDGADPGGGSLAWDEHGNLDATTIAGGPVTGSCPYGCGTAFELTPSGAEKILHTFGITAGDGSTPYEGFVRDADGNLYGTTFTGGAYGFGNVFELTPSGTQTVLYSFCPVVYCSGDGANPYASLVRDAEGNFYGTTFDGGDHGVGSVFELTASGEEKLLYSFFGETDGGYPYARLVRDAEGNLYGTTWQGGSTNSSCSGSSCGTVFEVTASGAEKTLYRFTGGADGGNPFSGLVRDADGNLYGTTTYGGDLSCYDGYFYGCGVVFKVSP